MFTTTLKVQGFQIDVNGHVNNARYLEYLEVARWEMIVNSGLEQLALDGTLAMVVTEINIRYRQPAQFCDMLRIDSVVTKLRSRQCRLQQTITRLGDDAIIATAEVAFMLFDTVNNRAGRFPPELMDVLSQHVATP